MFLRQVLCINKVYLHDVTLKSMCTCSFYNVIMCLALLFSDKINLSLGRHYHSVGKFGKFVGVSN